MNSLDRTRNLFISFSIVIRSTTQANDCSCQADHHPDIRKMAQHHHGSRMEYAMFIFSTGTSLHLSSFVQKPDAGNVDFEEGDGLPRIFTRQVSQTRGDIWRRSRCGMLLKGDLLFGARRSGPTSSICQQQTSSESINTRSKWHVLSGPLSQHRGFGHVSLVGEHASSEQRPFLELPRLLHTKPGSIWPRL